MSFITLENVSHSYFSKESYTKAIEAVNLSIEEGSFISIVGPSGCGKSTILSIIAQLIKQTEGSVHIHDKPIHEAKPSIGYMLQQDYLFPWKTIMENLLIGPKINRSINDSTIKEAKKLLKQVQLSHTENDYPTALSGGMRQRAALARTLITDPDILLFDEPFSALDYVTKLKLENTVSQLTKEYHKTTILVTHDLGEAISMSDHIVLMKSSPGKVAKIFSVTEELRKETPFFVRRHPAYQELFDAIWGYLNEDPSLAPEGRNSDQDGK